MSKNNETKTNFNIIISLTSLIILLIIVVIHQYLQKQNKKISKQEVEEVQLQWANAIVRISDIYLKNGNYKAAALQAAQELYSYGQSNVNDILFKPTKAAEHPFRPTANEALSYFIGGQNVDNGYYEDKGFAINGGKGWKKVEFQNHNIVCHDDVAIAMGTYFFTNATTNERVKVEYTFGYKRNNDKKIRIFLHHSSVPYKV